eukprot:43737-Rhodomonas_salina.1
MLRTLTVAALAASASAFVAPITTGRVTGAVSSLSSCFVVVFWSDPVDLVWRSAGFERGWLVKLCSRKEEKCLVEDHFMCCLSIVPPWRSLSPQTFRPALTTMCE